MRKTNIFLLAALLSVSATASYASIITNGSFSIAGTIFVTGPGGVTTPAGVCPPGIQCIFFQDTATPVVNDKIDIAPVGLPNGDIPVAISGVNAGNIANLFSPPGTVGSIFPAMPFMSFNNGGITTVLEINFVPAGINGSAGCTASPPAGGQKCTPPGSLFNLQNLTATSSTASWKFQGIAMDLTSTWTGTFTSTFNTIPYQTVLANLSTNGFASSTFAGQITLTVIPEPDPLSLLFLGGGMIACAALLRRVRQL